MNDFPEGMTESNTAVLCLGAKTIEDGSVLAVIAGLQHMVECGTCKCYDYLMLESSEHAGDCVPCKAKENKESLEKWVEAYWVWKRESSAGESDGETQ